MFHSHFIKITIGLIVFATWIGAEEIGYNSHVRPILSDKCFLCHGPDVKQNKAGLRLDTEEGAYSLLKDSKTKHGIVPGSPEESDVWQRIISTDPERVMPTPKSNLKLTDEEKSIIKQWIEKGATYEPHWAFVDLPNEIKVPEISDPAWAKNPIDHFVAAKLAENKLNPSSKAEHRRWFRRVTFSLTGLPPTVQEIDQFEVMLRDEGEEMTYEKNVDRLLNTRAYAEHMATPWLDAARYADTWGYHIDAGLTAYPYRDWVVRAFQNDKPYDQFVTESLAGDLLPNATKDQILATAFNRLNRMTNEGGSNELEFHVDGVSDRVHTVGTAFLGLTMECAKCHDHKYDPITAKDYYQLFSFFNSIKGGSLYVHSKISPPPSLLLPNKGQADKLAALNKKASDLELQLAATVESSKDDYESWKTSMLEMISGEVEVSDESQGKLTIADQTSYFDFDKANSNPLYSRIGEILDEDKKVVPPKGNLKKPQFVNGSEGNGSALQLNGDNGLVMEKLFVNDRYTPFTMGLWVKDTLREKRSVVIAQRSFGTEVGYNGVALRTENGFLSAKIFRDWPANGIGIKSIKQLPKGEWHHLTWTYDGRSKASGLKIYLNGEIFETEVIGDEIFKSASTRTYREGHFTLGAIFRGPGFKGGQVDELTTFDRALTPLEVRHIAGKADLNESFTSTSDEELYSYYLANIHNGYRELAKKIAANQKAITLLEDKFVEVPVMDELPEPRPAHVLARGDFNAERTEKNRVKRDSLSFLLPFPEDAPRNRLGLAQWLTLPNHPLTSRVYVNRVWSGLFGKGLVGTAENFGLQGDLPTHPELFDWLCRDFINQGWSTKKLIRQIVLSATFRQSSKLTKELLEKDLDNSLFSRGPAYRLSAEEIRDAALASSGLLREMKGGKPVRPYSPIIKDQKNSSHHSHRRSLYSYWKRTSPQPNMTIFDKPSLEICSVYRVRTNSPAQALVLLNDTQFVEAARHLATRLILNQSEPEERVKEAWKVVTSEDPDETEFKVLNDLLIEQRVYFKERPESASKLLEIGVTPLPEDIDKTEAAAMTVVCQAIYNTDFAVYKR